MFFPACQITSLVLQQGKNEDILVQIGPFESSKNKLKQTLCDSYIVLVSMCMYIWSTYSSVFTISYYVIIIGRRWRLKFGIFAVTSFLNRPLTDLIPNKSTFIKKVSIKSTNLKSLIFLMLMRLCLSSLYMQQWRKYREVDSTSKSKLQIGFSVSWNPESYMFQFIFTQIT